MKDCTSHYGSIFISVSDFKCHVIFSSYTQKIHMTYFIVLWTIKTPNTSEYCPAEHSPAEPLKAGTVPPKGWS